MSPATGLDGLRVLVTRPADQAGPLCALIEAAGGKALRQPAIEIHPLADNQPLQALAAGLDSFQLAVFVSANAVNAGLAFMLAQRDWPGSVKIAAVGPTSASAIARHGLALEYVPEREFSSEGLLALDALQDMHGQRVLIFRGNGGRSKLYEVLTARGAVVEYAEVYRRTRPDPDPRSLLPYWQPGAVDVVAVNSNETLENLFAMAGPQGQDLLRGMQLLVPGPRQVACAEQLGFRLPPIVAENASDEAVLAALRQRFAG